MTTDRDDELIDRIEAGVAPASDDEAVARAPYERLIGRLKELDRREPPAGWAERVDARVRVERDHERRRRRRLWAGGVAAALGAAIVVVIVVRGGDERTPPAGTRVAVVARDGTMRSGAAAMVGDVLRIHAPRTQAHVELRVYRDAVLVARCPVDAACVLDDDRLAIDLPLTDAGAYEVVVLSSRSPLPAPGATLDVDILAARRAGATIERRPMVRVEP